MVDNCKCCSKPLYPNRSPVTLEQTVLSVSLAYNFVYFLRLITELVRAWATWTMQRMDKDLLSPLESWWLPPVFFFALLSSNLWCSVFFSHSTFLTVTLSNGLRWLMSLHILCVIFRFSFEYYNFYPDRKVLRA